jgi:hypothetical protein
MSGLNVMFVLAGNCRTFIDCFDSMYSNIISKLFSEESSNNIFIYLYLKLNDPGPKGQPNWDFQYKDIEYNILIEKINEIKEKYVNIHVDYKILSSNAISDDEIMRKVKDRRLYMNFFNSDNLLLRALHCHYNLEECGKYILEKEQSLNITFDYLMYIRPDLFFMNPCNTIETYNKSVVTIGKGPNHYNNDHIALIPRQHLEAFFFDRIKVYENNTSKHFESAESVYWHTIIFEVKPIGNYYIKRS